MIISENARIYCSSKTWLEGDAVEQFKRVMTFEGILRGAAYPDLHPGRGIPVGAAFTSNNMIYPVLIGSDIGCGMTLSVADIPLRKWKAKRIIRFLGDTPEEQLQHTAKEQLASMENIPEDPLDMLGTLGHGNHFAEILTPESIEEPEIWKSITPEEAQVFLLIHSGSRYYGEQLWRKYASENGDNGVKADSEAGQNYLFRHDALVKWAEFNRKLITKTFGKILSCNFHCVINSVHNSISRMEDGLWLHRKGASEAFSGKPLVIAGSRGTYSYVVLPQGNPQEYLWSLAHGSGRKWTRGSTRSRMKDKYDVKELLKTGLGSQVICPDKDLLYEEAPDAYKNVEHVISDLQRAGLIKVIARLKPLLNCKP